MILKYLSSVSVLDDQVGLLPVDSFDRPPSCTRPHKLFAAIFVTTPQHVDISAQYVTNNDNTQNAFQPGLGVCAASLSSPGTLVLSDLIRARNRQVVNVRQDHIAFRSSQTI